MISRTRLRSLYLVILSMLIVHVMWQLTLLVSRQGMMLDHVDVRRLMMLSVPLSVMNKLMYE